MLNADTIEYLNTLQRPNETTVVEYGKYSNRERKAIYNDGNKRYEVKTKAINEIEVNSSRALIEFVKSEFTRRKNKTGKNASLQINLAGGEFTADDDFNEGICSYGRITSEQWQFIKSIEGRIMNHEEFLMALLKLSPSIKDFQKTYRAFLKLRVIGKSEMVSNPVYIDGQAESGYMVKYKLDGGQGTDAVIPDKFTIEIPYIKASKDKYAIDVECQVLNNGSNEIRIKVNVPLLEYIEETAIIDEINNIKEQLKDYTELLVLSDI